MYALAVAAAFLPQPCKPFIVIALLAGYGLYAWYTMHSGQSLSAEGLRPLYLSRGARPGYFLILLQLGLGLGAIVGGAEYFIHGIVYAAQLYGLHPLILSMIIAPIATELPEKFNSVLWIAHGKDRLALGNVTGAMVFQSTLIPAMGILLSEWTLNLAAGLSVILLLLTVGVLYSKIHRQGSVTAVSLICCGLGYLVFLLTVLWSIL